MEEKQTEVPEIANMSALSDLSGRIMAVAANKAIDSKQRRVIIEGLIKESPSLITNGFKISTYRPQKYDIILVETVNGKHYGIIAKVDIEFSTIWVIVVTSSQNFSMSTPVVESRILRGNYCIYFHPVYLHKEGGFKFCGIYDATKEFDCVCKSIKNYCKVNFLY